MHYLNGLAPDTPIYKYIPVKYVAQMFRSKKLLIQQMNEWEDVYENYLLKQNFINKDGTPIDTQNVKESCYGQSWSKLKESDSMWRIYSPDKTAIKVKTTAEKLLNLLIPMQFAEITIANVQYRPQQDIEKEFQQIQDNQTSIQKTESLINLIRQSHLTKRSEFAHEEEVRIVTMLEVDRPKKFEKYLEIGFDPLVFFDELIIDPRADEITYNNSRDLLITLGADPKKISKSGLYSLKTYTIQI